MLHVSKNALVMLAATLCAAAFDSPAMAQSSASSAEELPARITPGWVFTPTVTMGATHDDNPVLAGRVDSPPDDVVTSVQPGVDLAFTAKHAFFGGGYRGAIQRYRVLDEYDSYDQGGYLEFRQQLSRRLSYTLRDNFSISPTTDLVEVAGVPFTRVGTRQNDFNAGVTGAITKTVQVTAAYHFQWVEFDDPDDVTAGLLEGGRSQSVRIAANKALNSRLKLGGSYGVQRATVGPSADAGDFTIQTSEATVAYQLSPTVDVSGGLGVSHLALPDPDGSRVGPAGHVSIRKQSEHAQFTLSAMRSFVPSYGFGGSMRNQQVVGSVRVPFARNRAYSETSVAWRRSDPVLELELGLRAVWLQTKVGYAFQRWLRVEGFYSGAFQDTTLPGGRIDRNRIGVQVVTARPMRLQ